jgi:UDP-N-acetylglucosamine 2-epimerase (non-hydrolysing)
MSLPEIHLIGGTPPEAVKLAPVAIAIRAAGLLEPVLVVGGQHPATVNQAFAAFGLSPDVTRQVTRDTGSQTQLLTEMIRLLDELFAERPPAAVIVQGDTTTSLAGALAAFWRRIPVVHLEAGLRSGDLASPFPDEANRRLVAQAASLHLAPTSLAAMNLLDEGINTADVLITGSTVVDATGAVAGRRLPFENPAVAAARDAANGRRLVLVTATRPESWGAPLNRILSAVHTLVQRYDDIDVVLSTDADPPVRAHVEAILGEVDRVTITGPLPYPDLSRLLSEAYLVLTDSGGIQQEAPSFGLPALVLRDVTERVESLNAGCARLVGSDEDLIVEETSMLLEDRARRDAMISGGNPYGDGHAARRAAQATAALLDLATMPDPMPGTETAATVTFEANA